MKFYCSVFPVQVSFNNLDKKYHEIRQNELKDKSDFPVYWKKYKAINNEEKKERYALVLEKLLKKVKEDKIHDGDLVENISESGYRTDGVYVIEKKGNSIKVADIGRDYDDYGHIDDRFSLSEDRPLGYWAYAGFKKASWHSEDLPEPIWTKFMKPKDIKPDGDGGSEVDLKWCILKFPMKPSKTLSLLKKAKEDKVKAFYFLKEYSPDYSVEYAKLDTDWLPIDLEKLTQQQIKPKAKKPKSERPSPSQSATLFTVGQKKKGNDGNMYQVKENKNGVKRWVKVKEMVSQKSKVVTPKEKKQEKQKKQETKEGKETKKEKKKQKKERPSPSQSAKLFNVGQKKEGNDGNMYQVKQNKNGVKRWSKVKK